MLDDQWIFFGAGLNVVAGLIYVAAVVRGRARPNRVTWLVSGMAGWIAVTSQVSHGVVLPALVAGVVALVPTLILAASLTQRGNGWTLTRLDRVCLAAALVGVVVLVTVSGPEAIIAAMVVHALGALPTVVKAYRTPETENHIPFTAGMINAACTLGALDQYSFAAAAFPAYFASMCATISFLIVVRPRLVRRRAPRPALAVVPAPEIRPPVPHENSRGSGANSPVSTWRQLSPVGPLAATAAGIGSRSLR
jgi:hypothetical protein